MNDEAVYVIRIAGRLGPEWSDRLAGMRLVVEEDRVRGTMTVLTGPVADQAAFMGVLGWLYEMGATILAVERRDPAATDETACGDTGVRQGS